MPGVVTNLRKLFKKTGEETRSFKQLNFLNTLSDSTLTEVLRFTEHRLLHHFLPETKDKNILWISHFKSPHCLDRIMEDPPHSLVHYGVDHVPQVNYDKILKVQGSIKTLPFKANSYDLVFIPLATQFHLNNLPTIPQVGRLLKNKGRAVFTFIHPTLELFLYNQNPTSAVLSQNSTQKYFGMMKENNLFLECLLEGNVDKSTKGFFDGVNFDEYRGIPLVLYMKAVKYQNI